MGRMGSPTRMLRMARYLLTNRPRAVLTHRISENLSTQRAVRLVSIPTPVFVTVHGPMSVKLRHMKGHKSRRRRIQVLRNYGRNQGIIAITEETAEDLYELLGGEAPITVIPNPIVTPDIYALAGAHVHHPWLPPNRAVPVVCFAGRMEQEKDLPTLMRAFAIVVQGRPCRLLLIGDGSLRAQIEELRDSLGIADQVELLGWVANPYPFLAAADLVVLSSWWDALPTVLIEALALGTPVVSTDCGAGPREILDSGRYGRLVPPRDPAALAAAMVQTLDRPPSPETLRPGGERYAAQPNADRYLALMLATADTGGRGGP